MMTMMTRRRFIGMIEITRYDLLPGGWRRTEEEEEEEEEEWRRRSAQGFVPLAPKW